MTPAPGVAFTLAENGDLRADHEARARVARQLGRGDAWATVRQVHGDRVVRADGPGDLGEADAVFTTVPGLPIAVFTADCLGAIITGEDGVGVAHAGWRGMAGSVIVALRSAMKSAGLHPTAAYLGPAIGPCCFEVGQEVAERFPGHTGTTSWGTGSVDLLTAARDQLDGLETIWSTGRCTMHDPGHHSHRATSTSARMASIAWRVRQSDTAS